MRNKHYLVMIICILTLAIASAQNLELSHSFYGDATINGRDVPAGSIIVARINNEETGRITISTAGQYGESPIKRLAVQKGDSSLIKFYVKTPSMSNYIEASQTANWQSAAVTYLDLTFTGEEIPEEEPEEQPPSTPGAGGGGSGGSGGPSMQLPTVRQVTKQFADLLPGIPTLFELDSQYVLQTIQFYVTAPTQAASVKFEELASKPGSAPELPNAYRYFMIDVQIENLDKAYLQFHVPISWFTQNGLDKDKVTLMRFDGSNWHELKTSYRNQDATYYNYNAVTEGFSYFAVKAEPLAHNVEVKEVQPAQDTPEPDKKESNQLTAMVAATESTGFKVATVVLALIVVVLLAFVLYDKAIKRG